MIKSSQNDSLNRPRRSVDRANGTPDDFLLGNTLGVLTDFPPVATSYRQVSLKTHHQSTHSPSCTGDLLTNYGTQSTDFTERTSRAQGSFSSQRLSSNPESPSIRTGLINLMEAPLPQTRGQGTRQYIIEFKASVTNVSEQANRLINKYQGQLSHLYTDSVKGFAAKLSESAIRALKQQSSIAAIYEDVPVKLGPSAKPIQEQRRFSKNRAITTQSTQSIPWGINRVGGTKSGTGKTVWVIDTGVDYKHPDLKINTRRAKTYVGTSANDNNGHGTHVAGTIAALNNSIGVVGVAAGATVIPVKVLDSQGSGYLSNVIAGVDYVARYGKAGEVVNLSLGSSFYQPLNDAVLRAAAKGIKFAIAAGNENQDVANTSPASTNAANVFTVSAIDSTDMLASFSNFGSGIDYAAPGVGILSTWRGGTYATLSGTSMATPHVAGLLALGTPGMNGLVKGDRDTFNESIAFGSV